MNKVNWIKSLGFLAVLFTGVNAAAQSEPYTETSFLKAQEQGKTVVLDFHAGWCSTCKKQERVFGTLLQERHFKKVLVLVVDYDHAKALRKSMAVKKQSTLIVFKGHKEMARSTGTSSLEAIGKLVGRGI